MEDREDENGWMEEKQKCRNVGKEKKGKAERKNEKSRNVQAETQRDVKLMSDVSISFMKEQREEKQQMCL